MCKVIKLSAYGIPNNRFILGDSFNSTFSPFQSHLLLPTKSWLKSHTYRSREWGKIECGKMRWKKKMKRTTKNHNIQTKKVFSPVSLCVYRFGSIESSWWMMLMEFLWYFRAYWGPFSSLKNLLCNGGGGLRFAASNDFR